MVGYKLQYRHRLADIRGKVLIMKKSKLISQNHNF